MEPGHWSSEHSDALRDYFLKGMSYAEIGREINARFGTAYSRNAVVGRAKRLGLAAPARMTSPSIVPSLPGEPRLLPVCHPASLCLNLPPQSALQPAKPVKLRCVGVRPRLIALVELEPGDCRYPYGGDKEGEEIAFAVIRASPARAIARRMRRVIRGGGARSGRSAGAVTLRLVSAA